MAKNVGSTDKVLRTAVGAIAGTASIVILVGNLSLPTMFSPILGAVALIMLATAIIGTCPIYSAIGVDTCSRASSPSR
jgi:hypothetical protein